MDNKKTIVFVGGFTKFNSIMVGGVYTDSRSLLESKVSTVVNFVTINSSQRSLPLPPVPVRAWDAGRRVLLQRLVDRAWKTVGSAVTKRQELPGGARTIGYVFEVGTARTGPGRYRVLAPATATLVEGWSRVVRTRAAARRPAPRTPSW